MSPTFDGVTFVPEGVCTVCNTPGETFAVPKSLELCPACLLLVARTRTGTGGASTPVRPQPKPKSKPRSTLAELEEKPPPPALMLDDADANNGSAVTT